LEPWVEREARYTCTRVHLCKLGKALRVGARGALHTVLRATGKPPRRVCCLGSLESVCATRLPKAYGWMKSIPITKRNIFFIKSPASLELEKL